MAPQPGLGVTGEHVSMATLADAGFKTITCGTSGSGCFFIANILLIVLRCAVILIKQDLESRRLKRVNQGHGTASTICIAITHSSPACGKDKGPCHKDPGAESPLYTRLLGLRGFVGAGPWGGSPDTSLMLKDLYLCALPSSKVFLSRVSFGAATRLLFCCVAMEMLLVCPPHPGPAASECHQPTRQGPLKGI